MRFRRMRRGRGRGRAMIGRSTRSRRHRIRHYSVSRGGIRL